MHLAKIIDLIAEVAAKQVAKESEAKEDTSDAAQITSAMILASLWKCRLTFIAMRWLSRCTALNRVEPRLNPFQAPEARRACQ